MMGKATKIPDKKSKDSYLHKNMIKKGYAQ